MGEIRKRGGRYWIRYYRGGRRYEESARTDKWEKARDLLRTKEGHIANGLPVSAQQGRYRFDDAEKDIIAEYESNGRRSLSELKRRIEKHLKPVFGSRRMADITTSDVLAFTAARLKAKASPGEVNRELSVLKRMYSLAVKGSRLMFKPHIPMLAEDNVRAGFFDREQLDAVRSKLPKALQPVVAFAFVTGWRIQSEVLPLEWRNVDRQTGEVRLDPGSTKNRAGRVFPFTDQLAMLFDRLWAEHKALKKKGTICPHVFHRNGKRIKTIRGAWDVACTAVGLPGRIPHDLRRSAVRNMERSGLSRSVAMQLTGHKTESVYRRYAITSEADLREGVARLNVQPLAATGTTGAGRGTTGTKKGQLRSFGGRANGRKR